MNDWVMTVLDLSLKMQVVIKEMIMSILKCFEL